MRLGAALLLSLAGLWTSLRYCLSGWFVDADSANVPMLWQGVQRYGWGFLRSYGYTQDNWLFTVVAPEFALFHLTGPSATLVLLSGWAIFVGCAGLSALLAARLAGWRAAAVLAPVLLLCSQSALDQTGGSYGQPVTHNSSLLWGLAALLLAMRFLARGSLWALAASAAVLLATALSDPWADAAFALPLLLAALLCGAGRRGWVLAAATAAATALAMTRAAGLLAFLPKSEASWRGLAGVPDGAGLFATLLPKLFAMAPFDRAPALAIAWTAAVLALVAVAAVGAWWRHWPGLAPAQRFAVLAAALSLAATASAFCLTDFAAGQYAGRFVLNWGFLLPVLVAAAALRGGMGRPARAGLAALAALLIASGLASNPTAWTRPGLRADTSLMLGVAQALAAHGLHYGYGDYWGSNPTAITWVSGGAVTVRPVAIDPQSGTVSPWPAQSSPFWYQPGDRPAGEARSFILLWRGCPEQARCEAGLARQFGPPSETFQAGEARVLVWPGALPLTSPPG